MSTLTLVRHGQATPFDKVTDRLSETGVAQGRALGQFWKAHGIEFTDALSGTLNRHIQTVDAVRSAGYDLPKLHLDAGWNEYRADEIIIALKPVLAERDPAFAALAESSNAAMSGPDRNRHFQRMLEVLMEAWLTGSIMAAGVETFAQFRTRVLQSLQEIAKGPSARNVVVFTSGGPIGLCVQHALRAPDQAFIDVNWRMRNASLTEFTFSPSRLSLDSLNALPHQPDRSQWTWR
jgi:broad specificity phosphatase PhoE